MTRGYGGLAGASIATAEFSAPGRAGLGSVEGLAPRDGSARLCREWNQPGFRDFDPYWTRANAAWQPLLPALKEARP